MKSSFNNINYGFNVEEKGTTPPLVKQVHGADIWQLSVKPNPPENPSPPQADGVVTWEADTEIYVFTADCVPLLFFSTDPKGPIAAVHCGWRGVKQGIAEKALQFFQTHQLETHVAIGPCISGQNYEVKEDLIEAFAQANRPVDPFIQKRDHRLFFDLPQYLIKTQLAALPETHIHQDCLLDTFTSALPSYRRNGHTRTCIRSWIQRSTP